VKTKKRRPRQPAAPTEHPYASRAAAERWLKTCPNYNEQLAMLVRGLMPSFSERRDATNADESREMTADLLELAAVLKRIGNRARRWRPFPALVESLEAAEASTAALRAAWGGSGYSTFRPATRSRGENHGAVEARRFAKDVLNYVQHVTRASPTPRAAALVEIALGWERPCADGADFADRCKRWSKNVRHHLESKSI